MNHLSDVIVIFPLSFQTIEKEKKREKEKERETLSLDEFTLSVL